MTTPLSSAAINPEANAAERSRKELQDKLNGLGGISGRKLDPETKAKKLREACEGFESIFIQKMWQEMRNTVPKGGLLQGREEKFWQDMYDQELSKSMTKAGGIGLADMMYEQLSRNLVSTSRSTAGFGAQGAFVPSAAPLVNAASAEPSPLQEESPVQDMGVSIYEGEAPQVAGEQAAVASVAHQAEMAAAAGAAPVANQAPTVVETGIDERVRILAEKKAEIAERREAKRAARKKGAVTVSPAANNNYENNGLNLAYLAKREAGDKLSSNAIRPPLRGRREQPETQQVEQVETANSLITQSGQLVPGSTAGLQAALELARSGQDAASGPRPDLQGLVAAVQARNEIAASQAASQADEAKNAVEPVTRKVRYSTNIPKNAKPSKKSNEAIRMLNVENTGVNSKQGQGIAAFHAAQASADQAAPAATVEQPQASAPIAPLKGSSVQEAEAQGVSYEVPPLRPNGLQG